MSTGLVAILEGVSRLTEPPAPAGHTLRGIADWAEWDGEFYRMAAEAIRWDNVDGMRDRPHAVAKPAGVRRVMCLGDSTTYGQHLEADEAWPQRLQALLDQRSWDFEVFNVALPAWSTRQQRIAYQRICRKYWPDQVLLAICLNDVPDLQNNLSRPPAMLSWLFTHSAFVRRVVDAEGRQIRSVRALFDAPERAAVRDGYQRLFEELRALHRDVRADGARLALLVLPFRFQLGPDAPPPRPQAALLEFCAREGLPLLDLLPAFQRLGAAAFVDEDHPTAAGAALIATEVAASGLLPASPDADAGLARAGVPSLAAALGSGPAPTRIEAARRLSRLGREAAPALPALRKLLRDPEASLRAAAARALGALGPVAAPAVRELAACVNDPDRGVRLRAQEALRDLGAPADQVLPELLATLRSADAPGRLDAARALGHLGSRADAAVPALTAALADPRAELRAVAIWSLGQIGPAAAPAVPALVELAADPAQRERAVDALGRMEAHAAPALPVLVAALRDPDGELRLLAARALCRIGPAARGAGPALVDALRDPRHDVVRTAARCLPDVGADPDTAVPALERLLQSDRASVRLQATASLRRLRPTASPQPARAPR